MTEPPELLTDRPAATVFDLPSADLLSHVLGQIRLTGDGVQSRGLRPGARLELEGDAAHVGVVKAGALRIESRDRSTRTAVSGDLVMLPHGAAGHRLWAKEASTVVLCRFRFDTESLRGVLFTLPPLIHLSRTESAEWLEGILHFVLTETSDAQPGAALMVSRLIDLVVIRTLRTWIHRGKTSGWFGGLADPRIASALGAIHERPTQRWSIEELSRIAGMSRSSFCERFTALVGRSPSRYHQECRLMLARDLLSRGGRRVGEIGFSIGYESEAAFSRAYKGLFGHSPRRAFNARPVASSPRR